jgi:alkylhydroperoxidase family enzyme
MVLLPPRTRRAGARPALRLVEHAAHFATDELAALLYSIVTINGWNRLAVSTQTVYEP